MATALDEPTRIATAAEILTAVQNDDIDMRADWTPPYPQRYIHRVIDFDLDDNGHLQFYFRNADLSTPLGELTINQVVDRILNPPPPVPDLGALLNFVPPVRQTPLDLDVWGTPAYIIYEIFRPRNMEFHPVRKAISHKDGNDIPRYGGLIHVNATERLPIAVSDCKLIYFVCRPGATVSTDQYDDGFNLRVLLRQAPHVNTPLEPRILELEIDPDIRHPGGSET